MGDNYVRRTAITRLETTEEQRHALKTTIEEWLRGCQIATDLAWPHISNKADLQQLAYDTIREQTDLGSEHAILATRQAADAITSCVDRREKGGRTSKPTFSTPTIKYDARTMTLFDDETVSLTTTGTRIRCTVALPNSDDGFQYQFLDADDWTVTESTLTARDGTFFVHLGFRRSRTDDERATTEDGTVLGVDLGIENLAVTSTAAFFSGRALAHRLKEFETVRGGLQQTGTRSAHRTLVAMSRRELRHVRDVLHRVSNGIIGEAVRYDCDVIVVEDLTDIRDGSNASWGHRWAYRTLVEQVDYKAMAEGIVVKKVQPEETSTRCAECGFSAEENRPTRNEFHCKMCGRQTHADYNAAKNIGMQYVRRGQQSSRRTGDRQLALKSGTVTPNNGFTSSEAWSEAESMDKSKPECQSNRSS